jgi:hypothetical protein
MLTIQSLKFRCLATIPSIPIRIIGRFALSAAIVLTGAAGRALADDSDPPPWRGNPGSTWQEWTFDTDQSPVWPANPGFINPYAPPQSNAHRNRDLV